MAEREQLLAELERAKVTVDATSIGNTMRDVAQQSVLVDMTTAGMDLAESLLRKNRKKHSQEVEVRISHFPIMKFNNNETILCFEDFAK